MNRNLLQTVVRHAEVLAASPSRASDAELLERFTGSKDEAAFAEIVRRHGPMVWAVCRHTLTEAADADDAFQATFLALVRSAHTIRTGSAVGGWLHGVAVRVCTKVRRGAVRRRQREQKVACPEADRPVPDSTWDGLLAAVHEEVQKLPEAERTAFVLCDLEGVRQPDAAERLGWKLGTLSGRLTRARQRLLERLTSRGLAPALAAGGLGVGVATACAAAIPGWGQPRGTGVQPAATVPDDLVHNAVVLSRAGDAVPPVILKLVTGVVPMSRTKLFAAAVFAVGGLAVGSGLMATADAQTPFVVN
ncbi:MAG TPA: sigma-70 family RNA polymerase sigma factor, partial [Gemmataceae bacterium]|nr:sigma-70 family RNA polymerase sigma factor [Gemmataceae bacterium]